ncbi:unnamed protein product [Lampetra fluviatilis]
MHPRPSGRALRVAHSYLADLLHAAASILEKIHRGEPTAEEGRADLQAAAIPATCFSTPAKDFESTAQDSDASAGGIAGTTSLPPMYALSPEATCIAETTSLPS